MNPKKAGMTLAALLWATGAWAQAASAGAGGSAGGSSGSSSGPDVGGGKAATEQNPPYNEEKAEGRQPTSQAKGQGETTAQKIPSSVRDQLEKLHAGNQAEVQLGQKAEQQAQSPRVKEFAQRMVKDHGKLDQELQTVASQYGVSLDGKAFQKEQKTMTKATDKITSKSGAQFDTAYMNEMVKVHTQDVKDVRKQADAARKSHPELAQFLTTTDGQLQQHLDMARQTQRSLTNQASRSSSSSGG